MFRYDLKNTLYLFYYIYKNIISFLKNIKHKKEINNFIELLFTKNKKIKKKLR